MSKAKEIIHLIRTITHDDKKLLEAIRSAHLIGPTISVINNLVKLGFIESYAIGGGVAVLYYCEPILTSDLEIFCHFSSTGKIADLGPMFEHLHEQGYRFLSKDEINIEGIPVQFVAPSPGITEEAIMNARRIRIQGIPARIFTPEYLVANMLFLNRPKDRAKISAILDSAKAPLDLHKLCILLTKYKLVTKWKRFFPEIPLP